MGDYLKERLFLFAAPCVSKAGVPDANQSVIRAAGEKAGMKAMPGHVFDWGAVV